MNGWLRVLALMLSMAAAAGCATSPSTPDDDILRVVVRAAPVEFDPRVGADEHSQRVHQLVYSRLLVLDENLRVVSGLAARLENPDPLTYIAYLRSGVTFHDGHELTAADVVYTFRSFLDPGFVSELKGAYRMLESVTALDDYRVEFTLTEPSGSFPTRLGLSIVPDGAGDSLRTFPIGTGPYRFVRYALDEQVTLSAFEGYWDGLPQNAGVILTIVPDEAMRERELRRGSVDLTIDDASRDVAHRLEDAGLQVIEAQGEDDADWTGIAVAQPYISGVRLPAHASFLQLKDVKKNLRNDRLTN